jgi:hypothetical protein
VIFTPHNALLVWSHQEEINNWGRGADMREKTNACRDLMWKHEEHTQFGRPGLSWDNNMKIILKCSGKTRTGYFRHRIAPMAVSCGQGN